MIQGRCAWGRRRCTYETLSIEKHVHHDISVAETTTLSICHQITACSITASLDNRKDESRTGETRSRIDWLLKTLLNRSMRKWPREISCCWCNDWSTKEQENPVAICDAAPSGPFTNCLGYPKQLSKRKFSCHSIRPKRKHCSGRWKCVCVAIVSIDEDRRSSCCFFWRCSIYCLTRRVIARACHRSPVHWSLIDRIVPVNTARSPTSSGGKMSMSSGRPI